jgi:hypothetical protein
VRDRDVVSMFCMQISSFPSTIVEKTVSSPTYVFGNFLKNQLAGTLWAYFWIFYSVPLVFMSVFMTIPCCSYYFGAVV